MCRSKTHYCPSINASIHMSDCPSITTSIHMSEQLPVRVQCRGTGPIKRPSDPLSSKLFPSFEWRDPDHDLPQSRHMWTQTQLMEVCLRWGPRLDWTGGSTQATWGLQPLWPGGWTSPPGRSAPEPAALHHVPSSKPSFRHCLPTDFYTGNS